MKNSNLSDLLIFCDLNAVLTIKYNYSINKMSKLNSKSIRFSEYHKIKHDHTHFDALLISLDFT